ncbi:response regulator [Dokdonia ponticola]|uniref:Response regulator n=1 Tax=Dokdonia ponticola TaxID=2041041 RepID=A0ABV9HVD6_9FLAO
MKKKNDMHNQKGDKHINKKDNLKELKVLIIEDHPLMQTAIKNVFEKLSAHQKKYRFIIEIASNCKEAYDKLSLPKNFYELILLDIQLPAYPDQKLFSGEDIGLWIKQTLHLSSKIIVITFIKDNFRIQNIIQSINPNGFLVKEDITPETLLNALKKIFEFSPYYSESVTTHNQKIISNNIFLDATDRQLLYELSQGSNMAELIELLFLSKSAIQKRKSKLRDIFNITDKSNRKLIQKAKELGFL